MAPAKQREAATKRGDPFATEWAMWDADHLKIQQPADARPERPEPVWSIDVRGGQASRETVTPRRLSGAA